MSPITALAIVLFQVLPEPAELPPPLFLVQDLPDASGTVTQRALVRVALDREHKCSLEAIVTKDQRFFGHFGGHHFCGESHVATRSGGVIDTLAKKVVHDVQHGELLGFEPGLVIYRVDNAQQTNAIYTFDLRTGRVEQLAAPGHWKLFGGKSPDKRKGVVATRGGRFSVTQVAAAETGREPAGIDLHCPSDRALSGESGLCVWLDSERILTHDKAGELLVADVQDNKTPWLTIAGAADDPRNLPRLLFDGLGQIVYRCGGTHYLIDVQTPSATRLQWHALGHDFEASAAESLGAPRTIRYLGKVIGQRVCDPFAVQTAPGLIAVASLEPAPANTRPFRCLALWSLKRNQWHVERIYVNNLIGFAKKR